VREELRAVLAQGVPPREVISLEPLLREFDATELAAAALRLLERERAQRRAAEANPAPPAKPRESFGERGRDERPRGEGPRGDRPRDDRPRDDRPRDDRPRGERPRDDRPREGRPRGDRPERGKFNDRGGPPRGRSDGPRRGGSDRPGRGGPPRRDRDRS
jgi:hypothetical protein